MLMALFVTLISIAFILEFRNYIYTYIDIINFFYTSCWRYNEANSNYMEIVV